MSAENPAPVKTLCGAPLTRETVRWPRRDQTRFFQPVCGECAAAAGLDPEKWFHRLDPATAHLAITDLYAEGGYHLVAGE